MDKQEALEIARIQLTFLIAALPEACAGSAGLAGAMTVLKDADGVDMLVRVRLLSAQGEGVGYADISIVPELGSVVLSIAQGVEWDEGAIRSKIEDQGFDSSGSFIAYAYPRVGLEISGGSEPEVRRVYDWVRKRVVEIRDPSPENYDMAGYSYSLLDSIPRRTREANRVQYNRLVQILLERVAFGISPHLPPVQVQVQYNGSVGGHPCFELKTQDAKEWCVPACIEMALSFYRYCYSQEEIAKVLGQEGPTGNEIELSVGQEYRVVEAISFLSCGALISRLFPREGAFWEVIIREILANRPLILFTGRHSRIVVGYSVSRIEQVELRALILFDPAGFKVCWELYIPSRETVLFSADLRRQRL